LLQRAKNWKARITFASYIARNILRRLIKSVPLPAEIFAETKDLDFYFSPGKSELSPYVEIYRDRGYEKDGRFIAKPGETVIDVGAHIGFYAICEAKRVGEKGKVFVIEPNPDTFGRLLKNIKANDLENVVPLNNAATSRKGRVLLRVSVSSSEANTIMASGTTDDYGEEIKIQAIGLDEIVKKYNLSKIDILKIDAEGAEAEVVESGLKKALPITEKIVTETHSENLKNEVKKLVLGNGFELVAEAFSGVNALGRNTMLYFVRI